MERHTLVRHLRRQRQLVRRMAPDQPLSAYVARHRRLPAAIRPQPEPPEPAPLPRRSTPGEEARMVWSLDMVQPSQEQPVLNTEESELAAPFAQDSIQRPVQEMAKHERSLPTFVPAQARTKGEHSPEKWEMSRRSAPPLSVDGSEVNSPTTAREVDAPGMEKDQSLPLVRSRGEQEASPGPAGVETVSLPASVEREQDARASRSLEVPAAEERAPARRESLHREDQQGLPVRRRGQIEERPLFPPRASQAQRELPDAALPQKPGISRHGAKAEQKTGTQKNAESEAAALFTSETPGRSPREWLALLMRAEQKQQPEVVAQPVSYPGNELPPARPSGAAQPVSQQEYDPRMARNGSETLGNNRGEPASWPQRKPAAPIQRQASRGWSEASESNVSSASSDTTAEPLSMRARQFLKPVVGFDPADVRIHRGPAAARFASAQQADAVAVGDDVSLAAGYTNDEPETLGLLAHELTHVARYHEPRFIPPVLNDYAGSAMVAQVASAQVPGRAALASEASLASAGEENLAERVERRATLRAREEAEAPAISSPAQATQTFAPRNTRAGLPRQSSGATGWGGLPAPWEPLPDWLASPSPTPTNGAETGARLTQARQSRPAQAGSGSSSQGSATGVSTPGGARASAGTGQAESVAQRAGLERGQDFAGEQANRPEPSFEQQSEPEPDLDKLARQVYAVLKRRLDVERRRMS